MRETAAVVLVGSTFSLAAWLVVTGWRQPRPLLTTAVRRLHRDSPTSETFALRSGDPTANDIVQRLGVLGMRTAFTRRHLASSSALRIIGRPPAVHIGYLILAAVAGLVLPSLLLGFAHVAGFVNLVNPS